MDLDLPGKVENYLMQLTCEVVRSRVTNPEKVQIDQFLLEFRDKDTERKLTAEEATRRAKAGWLPAVVGRRAKEAIPGKTVSRSLGGRRKGPKGSEQKTDRRLQEDPTLPPRRQLRVGPHGPEPEDVKTEGS